MDTIKFTDWQKLDLRVGEVLEVNDHPNADKLYLIKIDVGDKKINLVAGLKNYYDKKKLVGKKVIIFTNLEQKILRGIKSEGMILAADDENGNVVLLTIDRDIKNGSKIR
ncbi:MAG TPA: methionine--tRNA ligase subunit beta [Candidatus Nanoarchaeia archaeon]|nr:methionine--tRNA ligase subunit beta [Candidatus Nanoarchaeia archaeon]